MTGFTTELQIFPIPYAFGAPVGGDPLKFQQDFGTRNLESQCYCVWQCLHDYMFSCFDKTPACDALMKRNMDGWTRWTHRGIAYAVHNIVQI